MYPYCSALWLVSKGPAKYTFLTRINDVIIVQTFHGRLCSFWLLNARPIKQSNSPRLPGVTFCSINNQAWCFLPASKTAVSGHVSPDDYEIMYLQAS